jgi:hypothetical protein
VTTTVLGTETEIVIVQWRPMNAAMKTVKIATAIV